MKLLNIFATTTAVAVLVVPAVLAKAPVTGAKAPIKAAAKPTSHVKAAHAGKKPPIKKASAKKS